HRADGRGAGLLHETAPLGDEIQAGLKGKGARRRVGRVFTERKARRRLEAKGAAGMVLECGQNCQPVDVERRLADTRFRQDLLGTVETVVAQRPSEATVGEFVERVR